MRAQPRIDARLIAEGEISRRRETVGVEPALRPRVVGITQPRGRRPGDGSKTARNKVGAGASSKKCGAIRLAIAEDEGETTLEGGHSVDAPTGNDFVRRAHDGGKKSPAAAKGQVKNITHDQSLWNILRGQRTFCAKIVIVLHAAYAWL